MATTTNGRRESSTNATRRVLIEEEDYGDYMPKYTGVQDPIAANMWIDKMEQFFDIIECADGDKLVYAVSMLRSGAKTWWDKIKDTSGLTKMTWSRFKEVFKEEFSPLRMEMELVEKYATIKQGRNESVREISAADFSKSTVAIMHNPEGLEWPTQVDIPENDEREETPQQTETDEHENAHIPAPMAKEIKEMISQEIAKAQAAALSHLKEYFGNIISQTIQEELIANFAGRVKEVMYSDFSACDPSSYSRESNPFLRHRWIQDVEGTFDTSKCPDNLRVKFTANLLHGRAKEWWNYTLAAKGPDVARNLSWNEFKELFLQKARFLPKYINDQKMLMEHYVDMLRMEIREFISAKDWKNMDELMNAALEQEQETKKHERSPPKRRIEQGGSSSKKFMSNETYPRFRGKGYPQCANCGKFHPGECRAGSRTCFSCGEHGHISRECPKPAQICKKCYQPNHTAESCPNTRPPPPPRQQEPRKNMNRREAPPVLKPPGAPSFAGVQRSQRPPGRVYEMMTAEDTKKAHDVVTVEIDNEKFLIDLIPMLMGEIDVVISMDWLSKYDAIISCQNKLIRIRTPNGGETFIYGERKKTSLAICTYARAKRHLARGCQAYLAHIIDTQKSTPCLDNIPVVREFPDVFPEELPGIPPERQVEFRIDLIPRSNPIAKTPYRLAPYEMQELMKQLQELLDKGFIRPCSSP
ncbi:reverse transcriptase domain-containing protein [Tanacetum coccineum]